MINELTYRPGTVNDLTQLKELGLAAYGEFARILTPENWGKMQATLSDEEKLLQLIDTAKVYVCAYRGNIIGMAYLVPHGNPTPIYPADWCYIRLVGVHPDHRGKGIAKTVTEYCINYAKRTGETTIGLHTSEMMDAARHIYESLGFKRQKEIDNPFGVTYWLYSLDLTTQKQKEAA